MRPSNQPNKITIEIQYFEGCPNSETMIQNVKDAINKLEMDIVYKEVRVDSNDMAKKIKFRGSPTLLINGSDIEGMISPEKPALSCRYYKNGIPSANEIIKYILNQQR